jgi:hypothetical protein
MVELVLDNKELIYITRTPIRLIGGETGSGDKKEIHMGIY